jgi:hypothetical protein
MSRVTNCAVKAPFTAVGYEALLPSRSFVSQRSQWHKRTDGDVFMVHQVLFRQRQRRPLFDGMGARESQHDP